MDLVFESRSNDLYLKILFNESNMRYTILI